MRLPYMQTNTQKRRQQIIAFRGLNYGEGAVDGEFSETENLSTARFPCLSQRAGRATEGHYAQGTNVFCDADGKLLVIDGMSVYYDGKIVGTVTPGDKSILSIGSQILIYPDAVWYDKLDGGYGQKFGSLSGLQFPAGKLQFSGDTVTLLATGITTDSGWSTNVGRKVAEGTDTVNAADAVTAYVGVSVDEIMGTISKGSPRETTFGGLQEGEYYLYGCDEGGPLGGGQYKKVESVTADGDLCKIKYTMYQAFFLFYDDFTAYFSEGDEITVTCGGALKSNSGTYTVKEVSGKKITITGKFQAEGTTTEDATLSWKYPTLSCVCESDNRIWGAEGNTIYASALGDPEHFFEYKGVSTDSYAVAVGTDGVFTACCPYSGSVLFWKEDRLHKVLGSYPAQYEVYTYQIPGVQKGCEKSLVNIGEVLYYQGKNGIYAFTGGTPELISEKFGLRRFHAGRAGTDGERYYISMQDEAGTWGLYTFDPMRVLWLREDGTHAAEFTRVNGELRFLTAGGGIVATGQDGSQEGPIPWSATLCRMDETSHGRKGYSKLYLRADLSAGAFLKVEISTDGGPFRQVFLTHNQRARTMVVPILPQRCDNFRIRLSGTGGCIVRSLVREFSLGSEY